VQASSARARNAAGPGDEPTELRLGLNLRGEHAMKKRPPSIPLFQRCVEF
jgi:hypothetical protein